MAEENRPAALDGDRAIVAVRTYAAPPEQVFALWTDPRHIGQWWGPRGFITTTFGMDVRPGGEWRFVMQGPDGRDYDNRVTYEEVEPPRRLVYRHSGVGDTAGVSFHVTVTFEDAGGATRLTMRSVFPSPEARDHVVRSVGAVEGLEQTVTRLGEHAAIAGTADEPFVITRSFDAPRELVWKAWTERERLMQWFGPKGVTMKVAALDLRPGGSFHYCYLLPDGKEMWGRFVYREIVPPQRIVLVNSFSDARGGITRHPFSPDWPLEMLSTTTFAEHQGRTYLTVRWQPLNAGEAERKAFDAGRTGMEHGFGGTFAQLEAYLAGA